MPEGRSSGGEVLCAETGSRAAHTRPTLGGVVGTWGRSRPSASSHPQPPPGVVLPGHSDRACGAEGLPWRAVRGVARYGGARQGEVKGRLGVQGTLREEKNHTQPTPRSSPFSGCCSVRCPAGVGWRQSWQVASACRALEAGPSRVGRV